MNFGILVTLMILGVVWAEVLSCDSCGNECAAACGTRHFRTCCFNYLRKRSPILQGANLDPALKLELWLAKTRSEATDPLEDFMSRGDFDGDDVPRKQYPSVFRSLLANNNLQPA